MKLKQEFVLPRLLVLAVVCLSISASGQEWAKAKLEQSRRHGEWVTVTNGARKVQCWVVYPEVKDKATAVVLIHEIFGLSDWARKRRMKWRRRVTLPSRRTCFPAGSQRRQNQRFIRGSEIAAAIQSLPPDQVKGDLDAAADYVKGLPAANGKIVVGGFCWGGTQSFLYACNRPDLKAAFVFYGGGPSPANIAKIQCPVYGFYGEMDGRITLSVTNTAAQMKAAGKKYEPVVYDGAGTWFYARRREEFPNATAADKKARDAAWARWKELLKNI